jgi:hypothetical protein
VIAEYLDLDRSTANRKAAKQALGLSWLAFAYSLGLWGPSFKELSELNLLINPAHPDDRRLLLKIERRPFRFNLRLF